MVKGKKIIVGVTGSIAAYKSARLVRLLVKEGADVKVLMTAMARQFITPLTMATLSGHPVMVDFFDPENGSWNNHVDMGTWADLFIIAPATANTLAKMSAGQADNLLVTTYLSARCPVWVAPAMDLDMFAHPSTQINLEILASRGVRILEPATGDLASGLTGKGRMEEPERIMAEIQSFFTSKKKLASKKILITAGPTHEPVDRVRFIGNHSSGKMGMALARQAIERGAEVSLIMGPVEIPFDYSGIHLTRVTTAEEMYKAAVALFPGCDAAILAAAVSDFTPLAPQTYKIKRGSTNLTLELTPTRDIAATLGRMKKKQILVGFALETENELANARKKLKEKNLDLIVMNSLNDPGAGFSYDTNRVTIIGKDKKMMESGLKGKDEIARIILSAMEHLWKKEGGK